MTKLEQFWHNISDRDKLAYTMVVVFGLFLLTLSLFFQFGYKLGEMQVKPNPIYSENETQVSEHKLLLIDEPRPWVRGIEIAISVGLIILGLERLRAYKRRRFT